MTQAIAQAVSQNIPQQGQSPTPATVSYALINITADCREPHGVWFCADIKEAKEEEKDWRKSGYNVRILERKDGFIEGEANHGVDIIGGDIIYKAFDNAKEDIGLILENYHVEVMLSIRDLGLKFEERGDHVIAYYD